MQIHETKGEMAYPVRFSDTRPHYRDRSILYAGIEGKDWNDYFPTIEKKITLPLILQILGTRDSKWKRAN